MDNVYYTHDITEYGGRWPFIDDSHLWERRLYIHLRDGETTTSYDWVDDYRIVNPNVVGNMDYYDDNLTCFACSSIREYNVDETDGDEYSVSAIVCLNLNNVVGQLHDQYCEVNDWAGAIVYRVIWLPSTWVPQPRPITP